MTIARGEPILASDIIAVVNRVTAAETAVAGKQQNLPVGTILMYDGTSWTNNSTLPGWYKCDGQNGTPDLTDKFIRGGAASGSTGGGSVTLATANLPSHNHSLTGLTITGGGAHSHGAGTLASASGTVAHSHGTGTLTVSVTGGTHGHAITDSGHNHKLRYYSGTESSNTGNDTNNASNGVYKYSSGLAGVDTSTTGISIANTTGSHSHTVSISGSTASDNAAHGHSISGSTADGGSAPSVSGGTIGNTGNGTAFNVVPAYYTLIYIKKMA